MNENFPFGESENEKERMRKRERELKPTEIRNEIEITNDTGTKAV